MRFLRSLLAFSSWALLGMATVVSFQAQAGMDGHMGASMSGAHAFDKAMEPVLKSYLSIQEGLAKDSLPAIKGAAKTLARDAAGLDSASVGGEHASHYKDIPSNLKKAAAALTAATDLESARKAFQDLSKPMAMWGTMANPDGVEVVYCSMKKASWLQKAGEVRNPYLGLSMLTCGEKVDGGMKSMKMNMK